MKKLFGICVAAAALLWAASAQAGDVCQCSTPPAASNGCPAGWQRVDNIRVTGCCTPIEAEYSSRAAFEAAVKVEGWGRQANGTYIGWWDNTWHYSNFAMNAHGGEQTGRSLASDPAFLPHGRQVIIPTMSGEFIYTVDDHGPGIQGRMVNRWLGEGRAACQGQRDATTYICVRQ